MRLAEHNLTTLGECFAANGANPKHARTVLRAFYGSGESDARVVPNVGKLVSSLVNDGPTIGSRVATKHVSADGTTKLRVAFDEAGGSVESVLMLGYKPDVAAGCVSSQIGCAMGCDFCASTKNGLERSLTTAEIVEQFVHLKLASRAVGRRLKTLVFMGMGEPLLNFDAVVGAIRRIAHQDLGSLGGRHITVSTVGIVPGMYRLADEDLNVHLALSLHAPDDATRTKLIPSNRRWPVAEVMDAARQFLEKTGRIPTIEYTLLADVNDSIEQAEALAGLMEGFRAHVNLIPYNAIGPGVSGRVYARPARERMQTFLAILRRHRVVAHFRHTRGDDVSAACGQLVSLEVAR